MRPRVTLLTSGYRRAFWIWYLTYRFMNRSVTTLMQQFEKLTLGSRIWTQFCWFLSRLYELEFTIYHSNNKVVGLNACLNRYWGQFEAIFLPRNFFSFGNFAFTGAWIFRLNSCCRLLNQNKPQRTSLGGSIFFSFLPQSSQTCLNRLQTNARLKFTSSG